MVGGQLVCLARTRDNKLGGTQGLYRRVQNRNRKCFGELVPAHAEGAHTVMQLQVAVYMLPVVVARRNESGYTHITKQHLDLGSGETQKSERLARLGSSH